MNRITVPNTLRPFFSTSTRSIHLSPTSLAYKSAHEPASTQGHATKKSNHSIHKDSDVQFASVRAGRETKSKSRSAGASGEDEPFDAARQGNTGGEKKGGGEASGSFADQIGVQDEAGKGPGVKMGKNEELPAPGIGEKVKDSLGFDNLKKMRQDGRNYHTSARGQSRSFSTSTAVRGNKPPGGYAKAHTPEPSQSGYDVPPEALPANLKSAYEVQDRKATEAASASAVPSSKNAYSSTAVDPPNETLAQQAKDLTLADRNPQPNAEAGLERGLETPRSLKVFGYRVWDGSAVRQYILHVLGA